MLCEQIIFSKKNPSRSNQISNYLVSDHCSSLIDAKEEILAKVDYAQDDITPYLDTGQKWSRYAQFLSFKSYLAMVSITIIGSVLFLMLAAIAKYFTNTKHYYFGDSLTAYIIAGVAVANFATWICGRFSVTAEGSGIAEMKSILTGIEIENFFTITTLATKYVSCIMVKVSGLGMGYEGAFIHIIGAFAYNITKLPLFKEIDNDHNRRTITIAGMACAMTLAFGTPIGGMFFALDMCPANFQLPNMFKSFITASISYFIWSIMYNVFNVSTVVKMDSASYQIGDFGWFVLLGLLEGTLCTVYLLAFSKYLVFKRSSKLAIFANRHYYITLVSIIVCVLTFWHNNFRMGVKETISDLTSLKDLNDPRRKIRWWYDDNQVIWELLYCLIGRLVMFWAFTSSAIPFGVFGPGLTAGVILARLYGEIVTRFFGVRTGANIFAAAGCAAFFCGFSRSFTAMICVMEMTGEMGIFFPLLVTSLIGFLFSSVFNLGFFEMLIAIRKLPYLPTFMPPQRGAQPISVLLEPLGNEYLYDDASLYDMFQLLIRKTEVDTRDYLPIINRESRRIKYYVRMEDCVQYMKSSVLDVEKIIMDEKSHLSFQIYSNLSQFIRDFGKDAQTIISKRMWNQLRKIKMKTNQFVMGQFGTTAGQALLPQKDNTVLLLERPDVAPHHSGRITTTFEMDSIAKEKAKQEERDLNKKIIMELLSRAKVDYDNLVLSVNPVPVIVSSDIKCTKAHFLFLMLGIPVIWIQNCTGELLGKVTKDSFLKFKSA